MKSVLEVTEFDKVIKYVSENAVTEPGRVLTLAAKIYDNPEIIAEQTNYTTEARRLCDLELKLPLENFADMTATLKEAKRHINLSSREIWDVACLLRNSRCVRNFLEKNCDNAPALAEKAKELFILKEFEDKVFDTFDSELKVKENASSALKNLYKQLSENLSAIKSTILRLLSDSNFTNDLRDTVYSQRDGRTVFQVKAEAKNKILGIVHDVSASGQTFFIEPKELTELHNRQREIEIQINIETERILRDLSNEICKYFEQILSSHNTLAEIDFHFAKGKYSGKIDGTAAVIANQPKIILHSMKNPVLMQVCDKVIENDFNAGKNNLCTIITGSNTGGKTVVLKTIGLCALMAKAGFHVPCSMAEIYPFKKIFADIGDQQNIIQSLSTFSSHVKNLVETTNSADFETLILIDEICSGTDPAEGAALAKAVLKNLVSKEAITVVTTHYGDLKNLAVSDTSFENASVRFNTETLKPTYQFTQGISGSSNAVAIAENLGLSKEIINNAKEIFSQTSGETIEKFSQIEQMWETAALKEEEAKKNFDEAQELKQKLEKQYEEIKKEKRKIISDYKKKAQSTFDCSRDEIKEILQKLKENETRQNAMNAIRKSTLVRKKIHDKLSEEYNSLKEDYTDIDITEINTGDKVIIKDLNQEAEFLSFADKNRKAVIKMGNVKTTLPVKKLAIFDKNLVKPRTQPLVHYKKPEQFIRHDISYILDLRGFRYEEAMTEIETYLDKACSSGLMYVTVIHGHGSGVLKKAIREYLAYSPYVAKFRPGEDTEGGDGVTIVDLS